MSKRTEFIHKEIHSMAFAKSASEMTEEEVEMEARALMKVIETAHKRLCQLAGKQLPTNPENQWSVVANCKRMGTASTPVPKHSNNFTHYPFTCAKCGHKYMASDKPHLYRLVDGRQVGRCCFDVETGNLKS